MRLVEIHVPALVFLWREQDHEKRNKNGMEMAENCLTTNEAKYSFSEAMGVREEVLLDKLLGEPGDPCAH